MADRTIKTILELNANPYIQNAARAGAAARTLAGEMAKVGGSASASQADYDRTANIILGLGTALVAGAGLATKAASDWESAWAGVTKTVDGTPDQMAELEKQLRGLATTLPATHEEIAGVAEAAGQLGVAREDVAAFTETMIGLGETTNLTADEAATAIAQFSNVMHVSAEDTDNFAAALVGLGNAGASTEKDILDMASRLSGTGALIGASSQDILGLSSALSDVGISAEAGGGSISRVMQSINTSVLDGGDRLEQFAKVAGVSAEEFAAKWRSSPVEAFALFEQGLQGVTDSGGNAIGVLSDLGIKSSEETRAVLSLASNYDGLNASLDLANQSWAENTALVEEAAKRYDTAESKIAIAKNSLTDAAIDIGSDLLPMLAAGAEGVAGLAQAFTALPGPVKGLLGQLGLLAGATGLMTGGAMKLIPAIGQTVESWKALQKQAPGTAAALTRVGKAAGLVGLALGALTVANGIVLPFVDDGKVTELEGYANALGKIADGNTYKGIKDLNAAFTDSDWFSGLNVDGLKDAYKIMADPSLSQNVDNVVSRIVTLGQRGSSDMEFVNREWEKLDQTLAGMAQSGNADDVQATLEAIAKESGVSVKDLNKELPKTKAAMDGVADAAAKAHPEVEQTAKRLEETAKAADEAYDALTQTANAFLDSREAAREYADQLKEANDEAEQGGKHWEDGSKDARENAEALDGLARQAIATGTAMRNNGDDYAGFLEKAREEIYQTALEMSGSEEVAQAYVDQLGLTPENINTQVTLDTQQANAELDAYQARVKQFEDNTGKKVPTPLTPKGGDQYMQGLQPVPMKDETITIKVNVDAADAVMSADEATAALGKIPGSINVIAAADTSALDTAVDGAGLRLAYLEAQKAEPTLGMSDEDFVSTMSAAQQRLDEIDQMTPTPQLMAEKAVLERVVQAGQDRVDGMHGTELDILAQAHGYKDMDDLQRRINRMEGKTVTIDVRYRGIQAGYDSITGNTPGPWAPKADGGWLRPGLSAGGWVPGAYPGAGIDNVLWPVRAGAASGRSLDLQPLAGTEYVVKGQQAKPWGTMLEAINGGMMPADLQRALAATAAARPTGGGFSVSQQINGADPVAVARESRQMFRDEARAMAITIPGG